jgi:hypothetical protein
MCFKCDDFFVYGLNTNPYVAWKADTSEKVTPSPDVVVNGAFTVDRYSKDSAYAKIVGGDVVPLPSALKYMTEKCGHVDEIGSYLRKWGKS